MALGFRDDGGWSVRAQRLLARLLHPSRRHVSLNALLDAVNVCGLNGYDVLTLLQALFFHAMLVAAVPALWAHPSALLSLTALQLCGAAWAYRAFRPYVSASEGGKRDVYRFSLLPRPSASATDSTLALSQQPLSPSSASYPHLPEAADDDDGGDSREGGGRLPRASSAAQVSGRVRDVTDASTAAAWTAPTSGAASPNSRQRRLSTSETILAMKRPLLHARGRRKLSAFQSLTLQSLNPFVSRTASLSHHEHVRLSLSMAFVFPFRAAALLALFLVAYAHCSAVIAGVSLEDIKSKPLAAWRRAALYPLRWYCRGLLLVLGYVWIGVKGRPARPEEAPMVVCNHVGFVEPIFLIFAFLPSPVGAVENLALPVVGVICQALQAVPVLRSDRASRGELVRSLKRRCDSPEWPQIAIFPEGTTTNGQSLLTFKSGAFIAGTAVQPVCMRFPSGSRVHPAWVSCGPHPLQLLLRLLAEPFSRAYVEYLPVHHPSAAEQKDAQLYAHNVRAEMAAAMQVPTTNHSYEDALLAEAAWTSPWNRALGSHDHRHTTAFEFAALQGLVDLDAPSALLHLKRFTALDARGVGRLSYDQLRQGLGLRDTPETQSLVAAMDEDDDGSLDFREYLVGVALLDQATKRSEAVEQSDVADVRMRLICRMLDTDDVGAVGVADLAALLARTGLDESAQRAAAARLRQGSDGAERASLAFDELLALLRSDAALYAELSSQLFSPLPATDATNSKADVAEAVVEAEETGWKQRLQGGVEKVRQRFS